MGASYMINSISLCLLAFLVLVAVVRKGSRFSSLGLPVAYLFGMLLIHIPGAIAHCSSEADLPNPEWTAEGIQLTSIGSWCFVAGVWGARWRRKAMPTGIWAPGPRFWLFCLVAGWIVTYGLSPLGRIPSIGAAIEKGAAIWMLGVMLGLRSGSGRAVIWGFAMLLYPVLMLLLGGFLSYGSTAVMICLAPLAVSVRSYWRVAVGIALVAIVSFHVFLSYFQNRDDIRDAVWTGAGLERRVAEASKILEDLKWFDPNDERQLASLDQRLNQNSFVGLAAANLESGQVEFLNGRSIWEGLQALVPRIVWPSKPVYGGSPKIVSEMTGLTFAEGTSFGVGQVMEFYINFGLSGVVIGFLLLGWALGRLDLMAAVAERAGDVPRLFRCYLPAVALIQPNGSIVELMGGVAAGFVAAWGWGKVWMLWPGRERPDGLGTLGGSLSKSVGQKGRSPDQSAIQ